jgi:lipoprotein-anchoring transpeptidase ErfK/SrfK
VSKIDRLLELAEAAEQRRLEDLTPRWLVYWIVFCAIFFSIIFWSLGGWAQESNYGKPGYPGGSWPERLTNETVVPKQYQERLQQEPELDAAPAEDPTPPEESVEPEQAQVPPEEPVQPAATEEPAQLAGAKVHVTIDKSTQEMSVSVDGVEQHRWPVSTGKRGYETPAGSYNATSMNKVWYSKQWDNAPMPNSIFFMKDGHAIHGTKDVKNLGRAASHGCVRLAPENAKALYQLVEENGLENTEVEVVGEEAYAEEVPEERSYDRVPQQRYADRPPMPPRWNQGPDLYRGFGGVFGINVPGFAMQFHFDKPRRAPRYHRRAWKKRWN